MKTGILVGLAALSLVGLGVGVVAAQTIIAPRTAGGMQGGYGGGMMGGQYGGGMMGGHYGSGMMGNGGCGCANYQTCQQYMADHNATWDHNSSYGGKMG